MSAQLNQFVGVVGALIANTFVFACLCILHPTTHTRDERMADNAKKLFETPASMRRRRLSSARQVKAARRSSLASCGV